MRLCFIFTNLLYHLLKNAIAVWTSAHNYDLDMISQLQKRVQSITVPALLLLLWSICIISITFEVAHRNWLNWLLSLILLEGLLVVQIGCMIFLSPYLYPKNISVLTVSFLEQLDFSILSLQNVFLWLLI